MTNSIGFVLTQIATHHEIGFREFEIWPGMTGPVGMLHPKWFTCPFTYYKKPIDFGRFGGI